MLNYISAELYTVRRRKSTWALLALLLGLESLYILLFAHGECYELLNAFVTTLTLGLPMALLLSALVCSDMGRSGTLKNELSAGLPRSRIYLGKLLSALIVALIALALAVGLCLAAGGLLFRHSDPAQDRSALAVVGYCLAAALPLWVGGLGGPGPDAVLPGAQSRRGGEPVFRLVRLSGLDGLPHHLERPGAPGPGGRGPAVPAAELDLWSA